MSRKRILQVLQLGEELVDFEFLSGPHFILLLVANTLVHLVEAFTLIFC